MTIDQKIDHWGFSPADRNGTEPQETAAQDDPNGRQYDPSHDSGYDSGYDAEYSEPARYEKSTKGSERMSMKVLRVLRSVLSATHHAEPSDAVQLIRRIESSERVMAQLSKEDGQTYVGVLEALLHECAILTVARLDLSHLPVLEDYASNVQAEVARIAAQVGVSTPADPHAEWADLAESVQRDFAKRTAQELVDTISERRPVVDLMAAYRKLEPPTTKKAVSRVHGAKTARQFAIEQREATAGTSPYRFSSGLPTLDRSFTGSDEEIGFVGPGTFNIIMGPTGTGKSSFSYAVTPAFGLDLKNWGLEDAFQVFFHTEEESMDKLKSFRMDPKGMFEHLSDNLIIDAIGTSRRRMAETLYDLVIQADEWTRQTKRPIIERLPYIVQLDYIQSIQEPGEDPTTATAVTAEFLLRGVCAWNPEEMAKFSGVEFREYAGMAWPKGMEHHRVAVVAYAQLVKTPDDTLTYKAGKRGVQVSDFALLDDQDNPSWDLREGDLRLFGKNQMRGSGVIAQNAHSIVILHRSVPHNGPPPFTDETGIKHLGDTRARIMFDKSRTGTQRTYAPMRFDLQPNGFRAQYFDELAERALESGQLTGIDMSSYKGTGDPMVPQRPVAKPLERCRY